MTADQVTVAALSSLSSDASTSDRSRSDYYSPRQPVLRHDEQPVLRHTTNSPSSDTTNSLSSDMASGRAIAIALNNLSSDVASDPVIAVSIDSLSLIRRAIAADLNSRLPTQRTVCPPTRRAIEYYYSSE
ncbi:unnamed protein product [Clonostachys rhizophaga]|uniref:Uncharacterized protein n=1 Tax=Clonostachys rhizophaga TaxID=160324 RepID=A0A9N9YIP2_9HYPO|nr:unnamed protein product [Clonostachys rhizophaga]